MQRTLHRLSLTGAAVGLAFVLAACGGDNAEPAGNDDTGDTPPAPADGDAVTLVTGEFFFEPDSVTVPADQSVTITVDNSGGVIEHDFTLDEVDTHVFADPGETTSGSFSLPAGTYTFYCAVPGHRDAGMEGSLTAE